MVNLKNNLLTPEQISILEGLGWLSVQDPDFRTLLLSGARPRSLSVGQGLYTLGDDPGGLYGVISGHLDVIIAPVPLPPVLVHVAGRGWWFGDAALMTATQRRAAISARTDCLLAHVSQAAILAACKQDPAIWRCIGALTVSMFDHALSVLHAATARKPVDRVRLAVLRLIGHDQLYGRGAEDDPVSLPVTQAELGEMVNLSRNATGSALRLLTASGAIRLEYGTIVVRDRSKLLA